MDGVLGFWNFEYASEASYASSGKLSYSFRKNVNSWLFLKEKLNVTFFRTHRCHVCCSPIRNSKKPLRILQLAPECETPFIHISNILMKSKINHVRITQLASVLQSCIDKKAHVAGKFVHAYIIRNGFYADDIFLSNKLIEFYAKCGSIVSARSVFDQIPARNIYSWNAIVGVYSKAGCLENAYELFARMPTRNVVSWNTIIASFSRNGFEEKALDLYYMMSREGLMPTHFTFASVLSACGSLVELEHGRRCHSLSVKVGLDRNMYVENALVGMYSKCSNIDDAIQVFDGMSVANEVSCTSLMSGLAQSNHVDLAMKMFGKMHKNGIRIDSVALSSVLGVCARLEEGDSGHSYQDNDGSWSNRYGQQIHALVIRLGFASDLHVGNSLIDMYAKCGIMGYAEVAFVTMPEVNTVSWNVLIAGYGQKCHSEKAVELFQRMQLCGFKPDDATYISMIGACVRSGDVETAYHMFDEISNPNVSLWNAILSGYCQKRKYEEAVEVFRKMQQHVNVQPDRTTLALILSSCSGMGLIKCGKQVHAFSVKALLHDDVFVASGLVDMYSKCGNIDAASRVFGRMEEKDVVAWNSIIAGFALHSLNKEAFSFFKQMRQEGMHPTQFSYASVVSSCARLSSLSQGRQIHAQITKDGYAINIFVGSALIDMYAKCGDVEDARQFFDTMPCRNVVSWNEMIHGYAQNGCGEKAVELFHNMLQIEEEKPDSITFIAVLTACSHSGLVDSGMGFFNSMEKEHGIKPLADHYACIIDSLGRAGRFKEVEALIEKMPCKDDPIIWEILLSACRLHGNAALAKKAAEQLFHLDPQNPSPYVLLANIYSALGRWDDVSAVRKLMSERGVEKNPAYSWVEFKNGVKAFMVDDDLRMVNDVSICE